MVKNQFGLLTKRKFLPIFITQFLGAFNDSVFKVAVGVMITFMVSERLGVDPALLVSLTGALLILPMVLFSTTAGFLADKFEKSALIRKIKVAEILIMGLGCIGFLYQNVYFLLGIIFLMGAQSTFFGPLKYSILPTHLEDDELLSGNALVETGTFLSILLGNILGGVIIMLPHGLVWISMVVVVLACLGWLASGFIPYAKPSDPTLKINYNIIQTFFSLVKFTYRRTDLFLCILAISWFWTLGILFLSYLPTYSKDYLQGNSQVFIFLLTLFSLGIGIGSLLCNRLLKGRVEAIYVPLAALGISIFTIDLYFNSVKLSLPLDAQLLSVQALLAQGHALHIFIDFLLIAVCAGVYVVPLYAILQHRTESSHKARVIACNNVLNSLMMTLGLLLGMALLNLGFEEPEIFLMLALGNLLVLMQICRLLPGALIKTILRTILNFLFRVNVEGLHHFDKAGQRVVITPNHASFIDGLLLAVYLPGHFHFAIYEVYTRNIWIKLIAKLVAFHGLDPTKPYKVKSLIKAIQRGGKCVIFPEGRVTKTGALMKVHQGPGLIALKANAVILPIRIEGAQYSYFSRLKGIARLKLFPKITLVINEPMDLNVSGDLSARKRRALIGEQLYQSMTRMTFKSLDAHVPLFQALLDAQKVHGREHKILEDIQRISLGYGDLIAQSLEIGKLIAKHTDLNEVIGFVLPNEKQAMLCFFGCQAYARVPAILDMSFTHAQLVQACKLANIRTVIVSKADDPSRLNIFEQHGIHQIEVETLYLQSNAIHRLCASWGQKVCRIGLPGVRQEQSSKACMVLFNSSTPALKAVVLSHENIMSHKNQLISKVDFNPTDIAFNALPLSEAYGLITGTLLPILSGIKVFLYPSPRHNKIIPEMVYDQSATLLFGSNSLLKGYALCAHSYDFYSVRHVFAGKEKLHDDTRKLWGERFGVRIFEGYGLTETCPVIATNTPMHQKMGTVGQFLPGIEYKLTSEPGFQEGKRLWIKGPNVMLGAYFSTQPGVMVPVCEDGWLDTADMVTVDNEGYLTVLGSKDRFAMIKGQRVNLNQTEALLYQLYPYETHAVLKQTDVKGDERIVWGTTSPQPKIKEVLRAIKSQGLDPRMLPKAVFVFDALPVKHNRLDYEALSVLIEESKQ